MTSYSQSDYYNNENDALSCNSRPISSTLYRTTSNSQCNSHADIYVSTGLGVGGMMHDSETVGRGGNSAMYRGGAFMAAGDYAMTVQQPEMNLAGYAVSDNVLYHPEDAYRSAYDGGGLYDAGTPLDYGIDKQLEGNADYNGRHTSLGSNAARPKLSMKHSSSMLDGMYGMGGGAAGTQRYGVSLPATPPVAQATALKSRTLPQVSFYTLHDHRRPNGQEGVTGGGVAATGGAAALRLLPRPERAYALKRQLFENAASTAADMTTTATATTASTTNNLYITTTYDNRTISNSYNCYSYGAATNGAPGNDDDGSAYYALQRPLTSMAPLDYGSVDDFPMYGADSLSTHSDTPAYTTSVAAQKLQQQQQRKQAIIMAMTSASVIASGETRAPPKRATAATSCKDAGEGRKDEVYYYDAGRLGGDGGRAESGAAAALHARAAKIAVLASDMLPAYPAGAVLSPTKTSLLANLDGASTTTTASATSRKLPKRLPTPKCNNNNKSVTRVSVNGGSFVVGSKKLPLLPQPRHSSTQLTTTTTGAATFNATKPSAISIASVESLSSPSVATSETSATCCSPSYIAYVSPATTSALTTEVATTSMAKSKYIAAPTTISPTTATTTAKFSSIYAAADSATTTKVTAAATTTTTTPYDRLLLDTKSSFSSTCTYLGTTATITTASATNFDPTTLITSITTTTTTTTLTLSPGSTDNRANICTSFYDNNNFNNSIMANNNNNNNNYNYDYVNSGADTDNNKLCTASDLELNMLSSLAKTTTMTTTITTTTTPAEKFTTYEKFNLPDYLKPYTLPMYDSSNLYDLTAITKTTAEAYDNISSPTYTTTSNSNINNSNNSGSNLIASIVPGSNNKSDNIYCDSVSGDLSSKTLTTLGPSSPATTTTTSTAIISTSFITSYRDMVTTTAPTTAAATTTTAAIATLQSPSAASLPSYLTPITTISSYFSPLAYQSTAITLTTATTTTTVTTATSAKTSAQTPPKQTEAIDDNSLSIITTTTTSAMLFTTTMATPTTATATNAIATATAASSVITDPTTATSYADYLKQFQYEPTKLTITTTTTETTTTATPTTTIILSTTTNNLSDIKSDFPSYIIDFLSCDTTRPLYEYQYDDTLSGQSVAATTIISATTSTAIPPTTSTIIDMAVDPSGSDVCSDTTTTTITTTSVLPPITTADALYDAATTTPAAYEAIASFDTFYSSLLPAATTAITTKTTINTTADATGMATTTTTPIGSVFDDSFYDSYNVDISSLTVAVPTTTTTTAATVSDPIATGTHDPCNSYSSLPLPTTTTTAAATAEQQQQQQVIRTPSSASYYRPAVTTTPVRQQQQQQAKVTSAVAGKASSVLGGLSKGLKDGLDGVLSGGAKSPPQQPPQKKGFGFGIAAKFVPNVGGLLAGATAAVQQTAAKKTAETPAAPISTARKLPAHSYAAATTTTYLNDSAPTPTTTNVRDYQPMPTYASSCHETPQEAGPLYTSSSHNSQMALYDVGGHTPYGDQMHTQSDDMMLNATHMMRYGRSGSADAGEDMYAQEHEHVALVSGSSGLYQQPPSKYSYDDEDEAFGSTYSEYDGYATSEGGLHEVATYVEQMAADGTADDDNYDQVAKTTTSGDHHQQAAITTTPKSDPAPTASMAKKTTATLLSSLTSAVQSHPIPGATSAADKLTAAPTEGGGSSGSSGGGMFGSLLGKAAAAVQSATQAAVNQVQQKTAVVTTASADSHALIHNSDYNDHQLPLTHQDSLCSQYSVAGEDYANSNLLSYGQLPEKQQPQYADYYSNGNQRTLTATTTAAVAAVAGAKTLPTVPPAGSTGKKLPTINGSKSGYLIKQQPTEIYDEDLLLNDHAVAKQSYIADADMDEDANELFDDDDEDGDDDFEPGEYDVGGDDDVALGMDSDGRHIVDGRPRQQRLHPNYRLDSEADDYYMDPQQPTTPSTRQQQQQRHLAAFANANDYYEHTVNSGYDYREDYFNEEDEYKYLEKEQQQQQQKLLLQHQQQHAGLDYLDEGNDNYLEDNYPSEDSGNYLDESSSGSVGGIASAATAGGPAMYAEPQLLLTTSGSGMTTTITAAPRSSLSSAAASAIAAGAPLTTLSSSMAASMHQQIKKQDSIIMEEDEDELLTAFNNPPLGSVGANKHPLSGKSSVHAPLEDEENDDEMPELPALTVGGGSATRAASKKKVLMRGETEEVVGGHMPILHKPEVTAKQRWHWAYNKIIMQLNVSTTLFYIVLADPGVLHYA